VLGRKEKEIKDRLKKKEMFALAKPRQKKRWCGYVFFLGEMLNGGGGGKRNKRAEAG
jgi:hypothetical protein